MKSLKARLTIGAIFSTVVVIALCGGLLYVLIANHLRTEFDHSLLERARTQTALVEFDDEGLQFEWRHSPQLLHTNSMSKWFQVRDLDGRVLEHSAALPDTDFEYADAEGEYAIRADATLDGKPARVITLAFTPKLEEDENEGEPPTLLMIVAEPTAPMDQTLSRLRMLIGLAALFGIAISVLLLQLILWRELKPLDELAAGIGKLDAASLNQPVEISRAPAELQPVILQLNELLGRVRDTLRREKEFTAGAAHELRTPLAGIRSKLELALSRDRTPEQHRNFAREGLEVAVQMQTIIENLLALARGGSSAGPEPMQVQEALREAWRPFAIAAEQRNVSVDWEFAGQDGITAPRQTVQTIAANLFENAANYVDEGGHIEIAAGVSPDGFTLEVSNTGCTLGPDLSQRVFEPFWRADEVRTGGQAHAGLGLAICRRLAEGANGELNVQVIKQRFVATLTLPL